MIHCDDIRVLDHGYVSLVDVLGSDRRIAEAARVSYAQGSKGDEQDAKLIGYLYKNRHTSPFEQCSITFEIQMPIFVMRQFVRHRTFRLNEVSARYTELPDLFYIPEPDKWRLQDTKNKQGSTGFLHSKANNPDDMDEVYGQEATDIVNTLCSDAYGFYQWMVKEGGIAREMARMLLPVNIYTRIMVNIDLHNLMHALRLRMDPRAQWEIQEYARAMYTIAKKQFPVAIGCFDKYEFVLREKDGTDDQ